MSELYTYMMETQTIKSLTAIAVVAVGAAYFIQRHKKERNDKLTKKHN